MRQLSAFLGVALVVSLAPADVVTQQSQVLSRASAYVAGYEAQLSSVVVEEDYEQQMTSRNTRIAGGRRTRLRSDVLWTQFEAGGWVAFRDVFEVDGHPVRNRDDRLMRLFVSPPADALERAQAFVNEGAVHNIGNVVRTLNVPTIALMFLRAGHLTRSTFSVGGIERTAPAGTRTITFRERGSSRLIATVDGAPASGTFWVDEDTGRIRQSEVRMLTGGVDVSVRTKWEPAADGMLVPSSMTERYLTPLHRVDGTARYSNLRRFKVSSGFIVR